MLSMSDTDISIFLPVFARAHVPVAFLVPTPTGYDKYIMDATKPIRELLLEEGLHNYFTQKQGKENKVTIDAYLVSECGLIKSEASLYRPNAKQGDPRIWFTKLKKYCHPYNLLALAVANNSIYVFNLSNSYIATSLLLNGYVADVLNQIGYAHESIALELLNKIKALHDYGFIPTITPGDPGVGDTLEHALGIQRNNKRAPDYKGIELKASRLSRGGAKRATTRNTLFTKVPDEGMTYHNILDSYGKWQKPKGQNNVRFQIYDTLKASRPNSYDLQLYVDDDNDRLNIVHVSNQIGVNYVSSWILTYLKETLQTKHRETFWVKAESRMINGIEHFRYDKILHTKKPNTSLMASLFQTDKITIDLAAHYESNGTYRDHGMLFKMMPYDISLILAEPVEYDLTSSKIL